MSFENATFFSPTRVTCERCRAHGYKRAAEGKAAFGQSTIRGQIGSLVIRTKLIWLKTNGMPTTRGEFSFTVAKSIKQQAGLELIGNVWAAKAVDETVDSHLVQRKSIRRHDGPPRKHLGFGSLAASAADSSRFRGHAFLKTDQQLSAAVKKSITLELHLTKVWSAPETWKILPSQVALTGEHLQGSK